MQQIDSASERADAVGYRDPVGDHFVPENPLLHSWKGGRRYILAGIRSPRQAGRSGRDA